MLQKGLLDLKGLNLSILGFTVDLIGKAPLSASVSPYAVAGVGIHAVKVNDLEASYQGRPVPLPPMGAPSTTRVGFNAGVGTEFTLGLLGLYFEFSTPGAVLPGILGGISAGVYAAAANVVFNLFNLILSPILVFFMLHYKQNIIAEIIAWLPAGRSDTIRMVGREINASVGGYIRGQMVVSLIVAVLSTLALFYLGIDYPVLNGIFAGLASILPFIGVILATVPPLFFAYVKFQSGIILLKVIASFAVIYFLEGYVVKPLVFKESMDLNPLFTIIVVMAFGEVLGFWGILLAIPLAAAFKIMSAHLRHGDFVREP